MENFKDYDLKKISYIKIGGIAETIAFPENIQDIMDLIKENEKIKIIGNCTNLLFNDEIKFKVPFINLKNLNKIQLISEKKIMVESGAKMSELAAFSRNNDLSGIEELAGIPGTIGGLASINGGAHGVQIYDVIDSVEYIQPDGNIQVKNKEEINFQYRNTEFKKNSNIITKVYLNLSNGFHWEEMIKFLEYRNLKQPLNYPNLGSIFKNPENGFAAKIIEDLGFKGYTVGGAMVSKKHANFIINYKNAKYRDIIDIIEKIKKDVYRKLGINLKEEIDIWKGD